MEAEQVAASLFRVIVYTPLRITGGLAGWVWQRKSTAAIADAGVGQGRGRVMPAGRIVEQSVKASLICACVRFRANSRFAPYNDVPNNTVLARFALDKIVPSSCANLKSAS